jgi:Flp pilus assembly protein TadG
MPQLKRFLSRKESESGQALAEAALVFIIVILLLAGLVEFGWAYFHYLALQDAAGEGAAYGIMFSGWHDSTDNPDPNNITYRVQNESQSGILDWSTTDVQVDAPFLSAGNKITVTVNYTHTLITPLLTFFVDDGQIPLRGRAVQTILSPPPP